MNQILLSKWVFFIRKRILTPILFLSLLLSEFVIKSWTVLNIFCLFFGVFFFLLLPKLDVCHSSIVPHKLFTFRYSSLKSLKNLAKLWCKIVSSIPTLHSTWLMVLGWSPFKIVSNIPTLHSTWLMILGWPPFKIVSSIPTLHSRWPPLLKFEISLIGHYFFIISQIGLKFKLLPHDNENLVCLPVFLWSFLFSQFRPILQIRAI